MTLPQIKEWGAAVSELSGQLSAARRAWWAEASGVLTEAQRRKTEEMWIERLRGTANGAGEAQVEGSGGKG